MKKDLLRDKRILAVDDEPDVLETLEELLPECDVVKATTFEQAQELLESQYFDIAILDIMGVDGYQLLNTANREQVTAVMLTAHALTAEDAAKSFKEGAAFYVPKDRITDMPTYLRDILEAQEQGKGVWARWLDRLEGYFNNKFGTGWQDNDPEFWKKFKYHDL
jgi:CheY-like chemotaxis protein